LFAVQRDQNKLKSLRLELTEHENFNPYKGGAVSGMPREHNSGKNYQEWYAAEKDRIERETAYYQEKIQEDRRRIEKFIQDAPYPECDIIRFRVINDLSWFEIGELVGYSRTQVMRRFYKYIKCTQCTDGM
jgi:DNA-directed RNA polymerase specialized sigma24 family protein